MAKNKEKEIWMVSGTSESGDFFGPLLFDSAPSDKTLKDLCYKWDGDEDEDGPGDYGSYIHLSILKTKVQKIK